jgi:hypothetical protein
MFVFDTFTVPDEVSAITSRSLVSIVSPPTSIRPRLGLASTAFSIWHSERVVYSDSCGARKTFGEERLASYDVQELRCLQLRSREHQF